MAEQTGSKGAAATQRLPSNWARMSPADKRKWQEAQAKKTQPAATVAAPARAPARAPAAPASEGEWPYDQEPDGAQEPDQEPAPADQGDATAAAATALVQSLTGPDGRAFVRNLLYALADALGPRE